MLNTNDYLELSFASESGVGDGSTLAFPVASDIKSAVLVWVTVDGLNKTLNTDYTVTLLTKTITFAVAPAIAQKINIKYVLK